MLLIDSAASLIITNDISYLAPQKLRASQPFSKKWREYFCGDFALVEGSDPHAPLRRQWIFYRA
jgi:hypothetical protein